MTPLERARIMREALKDETTGIELQPLLERLGWTCHAQMTPGIVSHPDHSTAMTPIEAFGIEVDNFEMLKYEI